MKLRVKIDEKTFEVEVGDLSVRPILATLDGETFEVWPEEVQAVVEIPTAPSIRPSMPAAAAAVPVAPAPAPRPAVANGTDRSKMIIAPIPGIIVSIAIQEGENVNPGQELITLEAMKMKNAIRATRPGMINKILVKAGDRVAQGQPLVEYAD